MTRLVSVAVLLFAVVGLAGQPPGGAAGTPQVKPDDPPPTLNKPAAKGDQPPAKEKPEQAAFDVRLADDSTVRVLPIDPTLAVTTKYGKLTIPVTEVRRIDFGVRFPDG